MRSFWLSTLFLLSISLSTTAQDQDNRDILLWNADRKITIEDFGIKQGATTSGLSFAQFSVEYSLQGFTLFKRKFNKNVRNQFIRPASWIDTTQSVAYSLRYQQTLFDISEIYARRFRKDLKENRKRLARDQENTVRELYNHMSAAFSRRRLQYDKETNQGLDMEMHKKWELRIRKELDELAEFAYNR